MRYMEEASEDEIVAEVAKRVAERLQAEKEHNDIAEQLAERIFNRLSGK
jgi:NADPH-dependent 7-cyano-7-deazaguanine reductase QueF